MKKLKCMQINAYTMHATPHTQNALPSYKITALQIPLFCSTLQTNTHPLTTMATSYLVLPLMIIIFPFSRTAFSQQDPFPPPLPTISGCTSRLLPLTSCAPFVQGMAQFPVQSCCDNFKQLSVNQPGCLCLLLTNSSLTSLFPINTTLALQLPSLCGVQVDASVCSSEGVPEVRPPQVSLGANSSAGRNSNSSIAAVSGITAAPMAHVGPRPVIVGLGQSRGSSVGMKSESSLALLMLSLISGV